MVWHTFYFTSVCLGFQAGLFCFVFQKVLFDEFLLVHFAVCFDGDFCFVVSFGDDQFCLILADLDGVAVVFECLDDSL